jgi:hypothetical protein
MKKIEKRKGRVKDMLNKMSKQMTAIFIAVLMLASQTVALAGPAEPLENQPAAVPVVSVEGNVPVQEASSPNPVSAGEAFLTLDSPLSASEGNPPHMPTLELPALEPVVQIRPDGSNIEYVCYESGECTGFIYTDEKGRSIHVNFDAIKSFDAIESHESHVEIEVIIPALRSLIAKGQTFNEFVLIEFLGLDRGYACIPEDYSCTGSFLLETWNKIYNYEGFGEGFEVIFKEGDKIVFGGVATYGVRLFSDDGKKVIEKNTISYDSQGRITSENQTLYDTNGQITAKSNVQWIYDKDGVLIRKEITRSRFYEGEENYREQIIEEFNKQGQLVKLVGRSFILGEDKEFHLSQEEKVRFRYRNGHILSYEERVRDGQGHLMRKISRRYDHRFSISNPHEFDFYWPLPLPPPICPRIEDCLLELEVATPLIGFYSFDSSIGLLESKTVNNFPYLTYSRSYEWYKLDDQGNVIEEKFVNIGYYNNGRKSFYWERLYRMNVLVEEKTIYYDEKGNIIDHSEYLELLRSLVRSLGSWKNPNYPWLEMDEGGRVMYGEIQ